MALRSCATKAAAIDSAIEQLKQHINLLRSKGTLVKDTSLYKRQLLAENEALKKEVEILKKQLTDAEVMNGKTQVALPGNEPVEQQAAVGTPDRTTAEDSGKAAPPQQSLPQQSPPKQQQKQQKKKGGGAKQQPAATPAAPVDVSRLDMRVGFIRTAKLHPDADGLYLEEIDCGEEKPRQVISGLVKHIPIEEMQERPCILLCNLKPAKMRGIMSHAMVMCASTPEKVEILAPPADSKPGDLVTVEGFPGTPDQQLNPKKKVFEAIQPDFLVSPEGNALYKGVEWRVNGKAITAATMRGCGIK